MHLHLFISYKTDSPLIKNFSEAATELYNMVSKHFMTSYDEAGNIGKRYRRQDVIGTPFCITVDDETINNGTVTIRDRDSMEQEVIKIDEIVNYVNSRVQF